MPSSRACARCRSGNVFQLLGCGAWPARLIIQVMPWYLRKSLSRGPIRLNLSKSGLGASFGVKGLRIGVGPKGTYLAAGRGGLYYRQYFSGGRVSAPTMPRPSIPRPIELPMASAVAPAQSLEYAAVPANDDQVAAEINARLRALRWSKLLIAAAIFCGLCIFVKDLTVVAIIACIGFITWAVIQSNREAIQRRIEFKYDVGEKPAELFNTCVKAFEAAAGCSVVWRVTTQVLSRDTKYTAGAGSTLDRTPTRITFNDPRLASNLPTIWVWAAGGALCLLPDRMLFFGPAGVSSLDYASAQATARNVDFRESARVPPDATLVGSTWQYVNKNGSPDRRFANNRQLPILRYSELSFRHPKLSFQLEFSKMGTGEMLARTVDGLAAVAKIALTPTAATSEATT